MQSGTLTTLFTDTLRDICYAEHKILKALPKMSAAARSQDLRDAFDRHRTETEEQIERLTKVFEMLGETPQGKPCAAINGILDEGESGDLSFPQQRPQHRRTAPAPQTAQGTLVYGG